MSEKDGWTPGTYEIAVGKLDSERFWEQTGTETVTGETWQTFGIELDQSGWLWTVTHLPSGRSLASFERKTDAKRFCRQIANLIDWTTATGSETLPDDVRVAVTDAEDRCHAVSLVRIL